MFRFMKSVLAKKQIIDSAKRSVAQSSINQGDVNAFLIPKPSLEEQAEIIRAFEVVDRKISTSASKKRNLQSLFRTLLHQLMTAEIQVNDLDPGALGLNEEEHQDSGRPA